jgi:hypothetical protein
MPFSKVQRVYRRFFAGFAKIAHPLNQLLRKGESPQLGDLTQMKFEAFGKLRQKLLEPPIIALQRAEGTFTLNTDASKYHIGCTLLQDKSAGSKHPIGYWIRGLTSAEKILHNGAGVP